MTLFDKPLDKSNVIVGAGVWVFVLALYLLTMAPTVSFWDCGEFIACSSILGIPHPPGTPLYILFGRLSTLLPTFADEAARVNLLSALCSSLAALFVYLSAVRLMNFWVILPTQFERFVIFAGGVVSALFASLGLTQWNNSVETEVYGMAMLIIFVCVWLALIYVERRDDSVSEKIQILIVFLAVLGIGVHMTSLLILPMAALLFIARRGAPTWTWFVLGGFLFAVLQFVLILSSRPNELSYSLFALTSFLLLALYALSIETVPQSSYVTAGLLMLASLPLLQPLVMSGPSRDYGTVALIAIIAACLNSLSALKNNRSEKNAQVRKARIVTAVIASIAALCALLILVDLRGYNQFLILTAATLALTGFVMLRHVNWPTLIALGAIMAIIDGVEPFVISVAVAMLIMVCFALFKLPGWRTGLAMLLVALVGFSIHLFIPIRAAQEPYINQNNPQTMTATINFIERKQYGSTSMVRRIFERRAEWENQFGIHERMGFFGFFQSQYGLTGTRFIVVLLLGAFGLWEITRRQPASGVFIVSLLLACTVGLILYMNFADGERINPRTGEDYLEVRDRDYFFTPGYMLFGLAVGVGIAGILFSLRESMKNYGTVVRNIALTLAALIFLTPAFAIARNYTAADRSDNYIPYDYAWNILVSCDQDAVLFTAGDNDTFPLWCLQETFGIRKDVRVVNLSLANTFWYIHQIQDYMGVSLGLTSAQIDSLRPFRTHDNKVFHLQDQVVDLICAKNFGLRPIHFSVTVGSGNRKINGVQVDTMMVLKGMVFDLQPPAPRLRVDVERSRALFMEHMQYRGWDDTTINRDMTSRMTTGNVANGMLVTADSLRSAGDLDGAIELVRFAVAKIPHAPDAVSYLGTLYALSGNTVGVDSLLSATSPGQTRELRFYLASVYTRDKNYVQAESILTDVLDANPSDREALDQLMRIYVTLVDHRKIKAVLEKWMRSNPNDNEIAGALQAIKEDSTILQRTAP